MSKKPKHPLTSRKRQTRDRWGSVEAVVDSAMEELEEDEQELVALMRDCYRWDPDFFGRMSKSEFIAWNDARILNLVGEAEPELSGLQMMSNKVLLIVLREFNGVPEATLQKLIELKNAFNEDHAGSEEDGLARKLYEQLRALAEGWGSGAVPATGV